MSENPPPTAPASNSEVERTTEPKPSSVADAQSGADKAMPAEADTAESPQDTSPAPPTIPGTASIPNETTPHARPSGVDVWSTRLAAWAQVITVFVVIFVYFYTVRPAFQLQLLQEQTAQLQLEGEAAKRKMS